MQETSPGPTAGKAEWRRWLRKNLASIEDEERQSSRIRQKLAEFLTGYPSCCIATFSALSGEPQLLDLITGFPDHRWVLPRITGDDMVFHQVDQPNQLEPGSFGIAEPPSKLPVVPISEIDIFLCPALGFDERGMRLGRGKGFYDRALSSANPEAQRLGIAFMEQVVPCLPVDIHDIPMQRIIVGSTSVD